ncbi:MAG: HAD family hydrolase [bacterium]|nr:HAD family hydrolase [bacterium]
MNKKLKFILFDFDGVIVDTFKISHDILSTLGSGKIKETELRHVFDHNPYDSPLITTRLPKNLSVKSFFFKQYTPRLLQQSSIPGIASVLKNLSNKYPLVIVSSTLDEAIHAFLDQNGLTSFFKKIYGVNREKKKVKKIHSALNDFNVDPDEAVFITDTLGDIREARIAGVDSIAVTWGYQNKTTLKKGKPLVIAEHPAELLTAIQKRNKHSS